LRPKDYLYYKKGKGRGRMSKLGKAQVLEITGHKEKVIREPKHKPKKKPQKKKPHQKPPPHTKIT